MKPTPFKGGSMSLKWKEVLLIKEYIILSQDNLEGRGMTGLNINQNVPIKQREVGNEV